MMVIPRLTKCGEAGAYFPLPQGASVYVDPAFDATREGILSQLPGFPAAEDAEEAALSFLPVPGLPPEGFRLHSGEGRALISASDAEGAMHGASALGQLLKEGSLPALDAEDAPRYGWRGLLMDSCRHFFPIETLYRLVDLTALYRMNRFHLHLCDDQGFRFESERFPLLTQVGAWRDSSVAKSGGKLHQDGKRHGGFYTKEALKALVAYAKARGVEIVPEIDLPGHATAMIAAYPELGCTGKSIPVATNVGILKNLLCAGREETYTFLTSLLEEVMEVFPFPYIHIGGDEAPKDAWRACPRCQEAMRANGLKNERELQGHMVNRINAFLREHGRRTIIWNDGLSDGLDTDVICQHWTPKRMQSDKRTARHLNQGGQAIMSGFRYEYFDYPYAMTPMKKAFHYKPLPKGTLPEREDGVIGLECAMWTEWISDERKLFYNLLPRMAAAAELMWCGRGETDYSDFCRRLQSHYARYEAMGLNYAPRQERPKPLWQRLAQTSAFFHRDTDVELR